MGTSLWATAVHVCRSKTIHLNEIYIIFGIGHALPATVAYIVLLGSIKQGGSVNESLGIGAA